MFWPKLLLKLIVIHIFIYPYLCDQNHAPTTTTSTTVNTNTVNLLHTQSSTLISQSSDLDYDLVVPCDTHENCSSRIFSLDTYCCHATEKCCNWFQYTTSYTYSKTSTTLPFKPPSLLTILIILILFVCLLFVSYCFSILFCFCFKCGLFKRPRVILINSDSLPNTESVLTSADLIVSPKHSTSTSSSSSSAAVAATSSYSNRNRRKHNYNSSHNNNNRSHSKRLIKSTSNSSSRSTRHSPTARVYSNQNSRRNYNNHQYQRSSQSDLFIEYESNSPFLIPTNLVSKRTNRRSHDRDELNREVPSVQPSAPLALDDFNLNSIQREERPLINSVHTSSNESLDYTNDLNHQRCQQTTSNEHDDLNQQAIYLDEKPPSYDVAVAAYQSLEFYNNNNN